MVDGPRHYQADSCCSVAGLSPTPRVSEREGVHGAKIVLSMGIAFRNSPTGQGRSRLLHRSLGKVQKSGEIIRIKGQDTFDKTTQGKSPSGKCRDFPID